MPEGGYAIAADVPGRHKGSKINLMAVENPAGLIREILAALQPLRLAGTVQHDHQPAPHKGKQLPSNQCAVYVFSLS